MRHKAAYILDKMRLLVTCHLNTDVVEMTARLVHLAVDFDYTPPYQGTLGRPDDPPDEAIFIVRTVRTVGYVYLHDCGNTMSLVIQPGRDLMELLNYRQLEHIAESLQVPEIAPC